MYRQVWLQLITCGWPHNKGRRFQLLSIFQCLHLMSFWFSFPTPRKFNIAINIINEHHCHNQLILIIFFPQNFVYKGSINIIINPLIIIVIDVSLINFADILFDITSLYLLKNERCNVYNIFIINHRWLVVIGFKFETISKITFFSKQ